MSFVYPAGLWALLALGVFAAVCLSRHRSEVTPVSSTYLWRLSEQRRKKKGYWRTLKRSLFFVLQFLALALSALLIAQPIMPMPGSGVNVAVILDASASMQRADGSGQTRVARAVAAAERDMDRLPWGASVTVVLAGDEARVAADHVSGGAELRAALEGESCGWGAGDVAGAAALCAVMVYCYAGVMPLHGFSSTMVVGVLRGGGDVRASLLIDNFPLWCVELPLMCLLGLVLKVPNEVFCLCIAIEHLAKTPVGLWRIHGGKWVHDITRSD